MTCKIYEKKLMETHYKLWPFYSKVIKCNGEKRMRNDFITRKKNDVIVYANRMADSIG